MTVSTLAAKTPVSIDMLTANMAKSLNMSQDDVRGSFMFHIVIPYATKHGLTNVLEMARCTHYCVQMIPTFLDRTRSTYDWRTLYDNLGIEELNLPAIYFDHKVAGTMSTFSTIYLESPNGDNGGSLFTVAPSREKVHELDSLYKQWSSKKL